MHWSIKDVLDATGGELISGEKSPFRGFFIDSRQIKPDCAFMAIRGKNHDGHRFIGDVLGYGCRGVIICGDAKDSLAGVLSEYQGITVIAVKDTTEALGDMARFQRKRADINVIGVTGSSGKTTTRAMTAGIMSGSFETLATDGNFNNDIGLPLTLFRLSETHRWAVLELGASGPGEISRLSEICRPDIGIITNIGPAHLEGFGSIEGVARAKSELIHSLGKNGIGILNIDDKFLRQLASEAEARIITYGTSPDADVRGKIAETDSEKIVFDIFFPDSTGRVELRTPGPFMMMNALAAASATWAAGVGAEEICARLNSFEPEKGRLTLKKAKNGASLIDDTYNANPTSMMAAIETLASVKNGGRAFLVCGDMLELGDKSAELHEKIGVKAAEKGIDHLYVFGKFSANVKDGALASGMPEKNIFAGEKIEIARLLEKTAGPGDWILVKGSRSMRMEEVVSILCG